MSNPENRLLLALFLLTSCGSSQRAPFGTADEEVAGVPGLVHARYFVDAPATRFTANLRKIAEGAAARQDRGITHLALSGGGAGGAYGAGILNAWTESGGRPEFTIVSGVSTGALIAPFAFLGPLNVVFGAGLFGNRRFREMVARYVDEAMLANIAREHARGRRLLIVTTNLDAQRAAVWDMGEIAASGSASALSLFRDVLTASASIPVVLPPMLIDVAANDHQFKEMHVDGAVTTPVFTLPEALLLRSAQFARRSRSTIYILMNDKIEPSVRTVAESTVEIASRASSTDVMAQTRSIIFETYQFARRNGVGFDLT